MIKCSMPIRVDAKKSAPLHPDDRFAAFRQTLWHLNQTTAKRQTDEPQPSCNTASASHAPKQ